MLTKYVAAKTLIELQAMIQTKCNPTIASSFGKSNIKIDSWILNLVLQFPKILGKFYTE